MRYRYADILVVVTSLAVILLAVAFAALQAG